MYLKLSWHKRKLADKVAADGFLVVVPDFLYGVPANPSDPNFSRDAWLKSHPPVSRFATP